MVLKKIGAILFIVFLGLTVMAQKDSIKKITPDRLNHFSLGLGFHQDAGNYGAAFDVTSPYIDLSDSTSRDIFCAFRFSCGVNEIYGLLPDETTTSVFRYNVFKLGVLEKKIIVKQKIALFGEVGGTLILPNTYNKISSQSSQWGLYEVAGVEFYPSLHAGVFFEMGFDEAFNKCIADKLVGGPYYYPNGFALAVGYHRYF